MTVIVDVTHQLMGPRAQYLTWFEVSDQPKYSFKKDDFHWKINCKDLLLKID